MTDNFVHLHVHDEYSLLDGASSTPGLVSRAVELGQPAVAQTNHGNLHGTYNFHQECKAQGIKPIIGMEAYCAPGDRTDRSPAIWGTNDEGRKSPAGGGAYTHLTLLATGPTGVRNLFKLSSESYATGFYQKPRIDLALLGNLQEGIIVGSGCLSGELLTRLSLGQHEKAHLYAQTMKERFGDAFFIEVMDHGFDRESVHISALLEIGRHFNIKLVATNDSHYTLAEDHVLHDAMLCLGTQKKLDDPKRMRFDGSGYHLKSRQEMERLSLPKEALDNTLWVAEQVGNYGDVFEKHPGLMPTWDDPDGWGAEARLRQVVGEAVASYPEEYILRSGVELGVICTAGFADYFLVCADILRWAKSQSIRIGVGRGSAAGSLVAYLLGITGVDPIEHGLLFERFLNPDRVSMPDIDIDISGRGREAILNYTTTKYGAEYCARINAISRIGSKNALADSARIMGRPFGAGKRIADAALPPALFGVEPSLSSAVLSKVDDREVYDLAVKLEGLVRGTGMHAAGFIISPVPLEGVLPTYVPSRTSTEVSAQWDWETVDALGLVKFDFLGLKTLDVIDDALGWLPGTALPLPRQFDSKTAELLQRGDTVGCFQLSGGSMRGLLRRVAPRSFDHLAACVALYRPGPMGVGAHNSFADRLNGREDVSYPHLEFEGPLADILGPTFGVIVYQEQVMQTLQRVCGYSLAQADLVRKAMGKKDRALLEKESVRFTTGGQKNGFSKEALSALWAVLLPFADYAFGKSHSVAYAYNAYWTAWLKANHPWEFMSSLLTHASTASILGKPSQAEQYVAEVARMGIPVLPPSVNAGATWCPGEKGIRYGITSIKGVGPKVSPPLLRGAPYRSWDDFLRRAPKSALNMGVVKALTHSGAFDSFGSREGLLSVAEHAVQEAVVRRAELRRGERGFLADVRSFDVPALDPDWGARRVQELATLGVELSYPPVVVRVPLPGLDLPGWEFLRRTLDGCRGSSGATIAHGSWTYPTSFSVDPERLPGLVKPIGVTVGYES